MSGDVCPLCRGELLHWSPGVKKCLHCKKNVSAGW